LALENDTDQKSAKNVDDNKIQAVSESLSETETKTKRCTVNQTSSDSPANPSVDSSTDTLIPNDSVVPVMNGEKEVWAHCLLFYVYDKMCKLGISI